MAENHTYRIDLDLRQSAQSKAALKTLNDSFQQNDKQINELNADFQRLQQNGIDAGNEYRKILHKEIEDYDKKIAKLEEERVKLIANKNLTKEQLQQGLKDIDAKQKRMKAYQRELQVRAKIQKLTGKTVGEESKLLKVGSKMLEIQEKMNKLLGKEGKLRQGISKAASAGAKAAKAGAKVAKAGMKGIGIAGAVAGAVVGGVVASAQGQADKERALKALKTGIDPSLADQVYIKTGADFPSIVNALNTLVDVTKNKDELVQGASMEVINPGIGKLLLSSSKVNGESIGKLNAAIAQIQKQTGLQDVSSVIEASTKSRTVSTGRVSQTEYMQAYAQLSGAGMNEEQIERTISSIASKGGDFIENWNKTDLSKFVHDQQLRNRLTNMDLSLEKIDPTKQSSTTAAQSTAEMMRQLQMKKDELMVKLLPVVDKLLSSLDMSVIDSIADGLVDLFKTVIPLMGPVFELLKPALDLASKILKALQPAIKWLVDIATDFIGNFIMPMVTKLADAIANVISPSWLTEDAKANGGLATHPCICGEAGPELVLPLTRPQRCEQLMNQYLTTNNFNINGNPNALGLSQQINNHKFIRNASMW